MNDLINIFQNDAFSMASMTEAVNLVDYVPQRFGAMQLFTPRPIRNTLVGVEMRAGKVDLIQTSQRGDAFESRDKRRKSKLSYFETKRLAVKDRITANDLQFMRQFGETDQVKQLAQEIALRRDDQNGLMGDIDLTLENMRISAIRGELKDADGSVLYNYFDEMGIQAPSVLNVAIGGLTGGAFREYLQQNIHRYMRQNAKGARYTKVHGICGAGAFDALLKNPEFRESFLNQSEASELREGYDGQIIRFGGVEFEEYQGTDDGTTVAVADDEIIFIPGGADNTVFEHVMAPGEKFSHIGSLGQAYYSWLNWDQEDNDPSWLEVKLATYTMFINKRPNMVRRFTVTDA